VNATPLEFRDELMRLAMMAHNTRWWTPTPQARSTSATSKTVALTP
jgi:hypothetical protein